MNATIARRTIPFISFTAIGLLVCTLANRVLAYGVYEDQIIARMNQLGYQRPPSTDAPQVYSEAYPTPAPFDDDNGLQAIEGYLDADNGDYADMYCLFIGAADEPQPLPGIPMRRYTPEEFSVKTVAPIIGDHTPRVADPQLFLFDAMGHPVVGNDDISDTNLESEIPLGTITESGVYILAATAFNYDPVDADGNLLFTNNLTGLQTPTNASAVQAGWTGSHDEDAWYRVEFGVKNEQNPDASRFGAEHWIPEPGSCVLLLLGASGLALWRRRA
jgi:hypothetical protein